MNLFSAADGGCDSTNTTVSRMVRLMQTISSAMSEVLVTEPPLRDMTYYLCNGNPFHEAHIGNSSEMDLIAKLGSAVPVAPGVRGFHRRQQVFQGDV